MQPIGGKKALPLCILKILESCSDFDHPLTHAEIIRRLNEEYGLTIGRNALSRNISLLIELGYDISTHEENGRGAFLREREFHDMELLVLMDSVLTSRYIPKSDAARMIEKLGSLSNRHFRSRIPHVHRMDEWHHQRNREFFYTLERLSDAITQKKQVAFRYNKPKEDGMLYPVRQNKDIVSPFALVCANGQYYLIACYKNYDDLRHVRVDRMTDVEILEEKARAVTEIPGWQKGLNIGRYAYEHNFMFSGKSEHIELRMRRMSAGDVIDAFGSAATMTPIDEEYMKVEIDAAPEGMRYFALQFAPVCEVVAPQSLRDTLKEDAKALAIKYGAIET